MVVHLLRSLFRGRVGLGFCSRSNEKKFFSFKICNRGEGGGSEKSFFLRNVISERALTRWIFLRKIWKKLTIYLFIQNFKSPTQKLQFNWILNRALWRQKQKLKSRKRENKRRNMKSTSTISQIDGNEE